MANGPYGPDCNICINFSYFDEDKKCTIHDFVYPTTSIELFCSDFQLKHSPKIAPTNLPLLLIKAGHFLNRFLYFRNEMREAQKRKEKEKQTFKDLKPGFLYYTSYGLYTPPEPLYSFNEMKDKIIVRTININDDPEFGWSIYIGAYQLDLFPKPDQYIEILMKDEKIKFGITDVERNFVMGTHILEDGTRKNKISTKIERIFYNPTSKQMLFKWLDYYFNIELIRKNHSKHPYLKNELESFFALLEIKKDSGTYSYKLRPYLNFFGDEFRRDKMIKVPRN